MKLPMAELSRETFHLPKLGPRLIEVSRNLYLGCGFIVVRGLEPEKYSAEENVIIFAGVASYIAEIRGRQDEDGNVLRESALVVFSFRKERVFCLHNYFFFLQFISLISEAK